jgi:hypothetical protein
VLYKEPRQSLFQLRNAEIHRQLFEVFGEGVVNRRGVLSFENSQASTLLTSLAGYRVLS